MNSENLNPKTGQITIITGLPGSGKTTTTNKFQHHGVKVFDDYLHKTIGNELGRPDLAKHRTTLIEALIAGQDCIVTDIQLCDAATLEKMVADIRIHVPEVIINKEYFCNDPEQCRQNVLSSYNPSEHRLDMISRYSPGYLPPKSAKDVYRPQAGTVDKLRLQ